MNISLMQYITNVFFIAHTLITYVTGPCSLSADPGPCRGICSRFYFDASRGFCRPFMYRCCGGNANAFKSRMLCERSCQPRRKFNSLRFLSSISWVIIAIFLWKHVFINEFNKLYLVSVQFFVIWQFLTWGL